MKVHVSFQQTREYRSISKTINLPIVPPPGAWLEYEEGWGMVYIASPDERGVHLEISPKRIGISGYGPQFTLEELVNLSALGWSIRPPLGSPAPRDTE